MDHNQLDKLLGSGGWSYDNGWQHDSVHWDCYVDARYGSPTGYFVILSKSGVGRLLKLSASPPGKTEICAGNLSSPDDVNRLLTLVSSQSTFSVG